MPDGLMQLCFLAPWSGMRGHKCWSEASVTDISAGSAPTTTDVLVSQLQIYTGKMQL